MQVIDDKVIAVNGAVIRKKGHVKSTLNEVVDR